MVKSPLWKYVGCDSWFLALRASFLALDGEDSMGLSFDFYVGMKWGDSKLALIELAS